MRDAVDTLLEKLLRGPRKAAPNAWNGFGDHGEASLKCPLFKTENMCSACCKHFTRDVFDKTRIEAVFEDAYTRFRLTGTREIARPAFRKLAKYACQRCPNKPLR